VLAKAMTHCAAVLCTVRARRAASFFLCLITPLCSYLCGGLYAGLYERAHIIRYFLTLCRAASALLQRESVPPGALVWARRALSRQPCTAGAGVGPLAGLR
jgi:hypothetical protein